LAAAEQETAGQNDEDSEGHAPSRSPRKMVGDDEINGCFRTEYRCFDGEKQVKRQYK
jgi:hypothetical protein